MRREEGVPALAESVLMGARWYVVTKVDRAARQVTLLAEDRWNAGEVSGDVVVSFAEAKRLARP